MPTKRIDLHQKEMHDASYKTTAKYTDRTFPVKIILQQHSPVFHTLDRGPQTQTAKHQVEIMFLH
jgi:hypothetical protein